MQRADKPRGRATVVLSTVFLMFATLGMGDARGPGRDPSPSTAARISTPRWPALLAGREETSTLYRERSPRPGEVRPAPARAVAAPRAVSAPAVLSPGPAAPAPPPGGADWSAIARCESGGRWSLNSGNGYWGGLQFSPATWFAYGGGPFDGTGPFPYSAAQQVAVAERVLAGQGPGAWPHCFRWA